MHNELGNYGTTYQGKDLDTMEYYWDDSCHAATHGYSSFNTSDCQSTNYNDSKVKEMLETRYLPTIGENNLKEIDGYKIRLIKLEELVENLGHQLNGQGNGNNSFFPNTPAWVYQNFGTLIDPSRETGLYGYWTMTQSPSFYPGTYVITPEGVEFNSNSILVYGVRPVINLLKSAIE